MESVSDRFKLLIEAEGIKLPWLEKETGVDRSRWNSVKRGLVEMRASEVEALGKVWPEYSYWIAFGKEIPEAGQISPMTKRAQRALKTRPAEG